MFDIVYNLAGSSIPTDHGYALYGAISRIVPQIHELNNVGIFPIFGYLEDNKIFLNENSVLRIRTSPEYIQHLIKLIGKTLNIDNYKILVGCAEVRTPKLKPILKSRVSIITKAKTSDEFITQTKRIVTKLGISENKFFIPQKNGIYRKRIVNVKNNKLIGFPLVFQNLTVQESQTLIENGIGGKHKMGCGIFI